MLKRVEHIGDQTLILGDCLEVMPTLGRFDHIISDPPYEQVLHDAVGKIAKIRIDGGKALETFGFDGIDHIRSEVAAACVLVSSGWVLLFCLAEGVQAWRDALQAAQAKYDTCLAWVKPDAMPRFNGQGASRGFECVVTAWAGKGYRSWNGGGMRGVLYHQRDERTDHPTTKPLSLMRELVELYSNAGDTILDPFMGSGTTLVACQQLGRKGTGIELSEKYFDIACRRVEQAAAQPRLFVEPVQKPKQEALL